jgi:phosphomannomutase
MTQRILSISGLRGVIGDGLDPGYVSQFAMALGTLFDGGQVVLARDGRSTGPVIKHGVLAGLMATGCRVIDAGIASTPTCGVLVDHLNAAGGLQITASHNPIEWNGLKPFSPVGSVFDHALGDRLLEMLSTQAFRLAKWNQLGSVETPENLGVVHLERILKRVDGPAIAERKLKVVLDCNHGSGAVLGPHMLDQLGCEVHVIGGVADGQFEHLPEPTKENLTGLCEAVKAVGADVGFAQDPDADRLAIVDENGRYIGEELTLGLCADHVLSRRPGPVVVNGSTSRVTADLAAKFGCPFHRSHVGEANVVAKMREVSAVLGGEGNGGVIDPLVGYVRDSFLSMAYVLEGLALGQPSVGAWADSLPGYTIIKSKLTCPREKVTAACDALKSAYPEAQADEGDGLRLDWPDRWVQVRASNTEPILRIIAEAPEKETALELCQDAMTRVQEAVRGA